MSDEEKSALSSIDAVCEAFEDQLRSGDSPQIESFLSHVASDQRCELLRHLLELEVDYGFQSDGSSSPEQYLERFPGFRDVVLEVICENAAEHTQRASHPETLVNPLAAPGEVSPSPARLGNYEILEVIGRGGMGIVYRARQRDLNRIVALKTIITGAHASDDQSKRFRLEAEAAGRLDHPGIVPVYEINEHSGTLFFSMGYVEGESLAERLRQNTLAPDDAAKIAMDIAAAISYAHKSGVVHRDLKPANVLIDQDGTARITDFGLAMITDAEQLTLTGDIVGTPSYMSPEQASADRSLVGEPTDIYAIGAILYASLSGHAPFRGESALAVIQQVLKKTPTPLRQLREEIPRDLETICDKCLSKSPDARYPTAESLRDDLDRYIEGHPILARPASNLYRLNQWRKRNPAIAASLFSIVVTLIAAVAISSYFAIQSRNRAIAAEQSFGVATEQSKIALKTIQTVLHTVQVKLKDIPEAGAIRRELLVTVVADLEQVGSGYLEQSAVDRESAAALAQLGELISEIGDETGTETEDRSEKYFTKSIETYLSLLDAAPRDNELRNEFTQVARNYGDRAREYRRFKQAIWAHGLARKHAEIWTTTDPNNVDAHTAYIEAIEALGEAMIRGGQLPEGRLYCIEAVELAVAFQENHPSTKFDEVVALCYCTLGDMHMKSGELDKAEVAFKKMSDTTLALMKREPDEPQWILNRSTDFERLGDLYMARQEYGKARESFEEMLRLGLVYVEGEPTNLFRLQQLSWAYRKLAKVCAKQGENERANWARASLKNLEARLRGSQ